MLQAHTHYGKAMAWSIATPSSVVSWVKLPAKHLSILFMSAKAVRHFDTLGQETTFLAAISSDQWPFQRNVSRFWHRVKRSKVFVVNKTVSPATKLLCEALGNYLWYPLRCLRLTKSVQVSSSPNEDPPVDTKIEDMKVMKAMKTIDLSSENFEEHFELPHPCSFNTVLQMFGHPDWSIPAACRWCVWHPAAAGRMRPESVRGPCAGWEDHMIVARCWTPHQSSRFHLGVAEAIFWKETRTWKSWKVRAQ